jgi:hypothetical protein
MKTAQNNKIGKVNTFYANVKSNFFRVDVVLRESLAIPSSVYREIVVYI